MKTKKTDNSNLYPKLDLRRYFLTKYFKKEPIRVFDCCQGDGVIWQKLRRDYTIARYWGVDVKKKTGRLAIKSERILSQPGWDDNVIDIDTYGSPWKQWFTMLPNIRQRTAVFLTIGNVMIGGGQIDKYMLIAMGLELIKDDLPGGLRGSLADTGIPYCLAEAEKHGLTIVEAKEAIAGGHARYIGLMIEPATRNTE
ncbi:MAG: hypothetical protein PHV74_14455 [Dehalococcoidia bacterium]|nr:hypothetical protein [Dehalococcoidia bacterium]